MIIINSLASVALDGVSLGNIILAAQNPSVDKDDLLQKLEDWHITKVADAQTTLTKTAVVRIAKVTAENEALLAAQASHAAALAALKSEHEIAIANLIADSKRAAEEAADALAEADARTAAITADRERLTADRERLTADRDRLAALLATASAAFDAGDIETLKAMREDAQKTENEKKLAAALAKKAEAEAEIAALAK